MPDLAHVFRTEIVVHISKKIESGWDLGSRGYNSNLCAYDRTTWTYNRPLLIELCFSNGIAAVGYHFEAMART